MKTATIMTASSPPPPQRPPSEERLFSRKLQYELASEEGRALSVSWAVSLALGIVWLLLVHLVPALPRAITLLPPEETGPIEVQFDDLTQPKPEAGKPATRAAVPRPTPGSAHDKGAGDLKAIGDAFGSGTAASSGGMVGDVSGVLRGVDVSSGTGGAPGQTGKAVIGYGHGGQGSRTPGRGGLGSGLSEGPGNGLGGVGGVEGVGIASVHVAPPKVVRAENIGGPGRDVSELGSFVRGRQSQLQFCYQEYGLKVNPSLAGTVAVAVTLTGAGNVTGVEITNRTWSGAGHEEAESCIRQRISAWRFPSSEQGGGTYGFSFVFSK
jgi:hypothetical protein